MSAEILRRASVLMREQANAVDALGQLTEHIAEVDCDEFADFIAAWDPVVARAVADVLDDAALDAEATEAFWESHASRSRPNWAQNSPALALARIYLQEDE